MELHRKLTFVGLILLVATLGINHVYKPNDNEIDFNYAYITGIGMLIAFSISFILFNFNKYNESKKKD